MDTSYWKGRKVLITGGTGFIGSHMTGRLFGTGASLTVASGTGRSRLWQERFEAGAIEYALGDLADPTFADYCLRGKDIVFHFASKIAGLAYNAEHPAEMLIDNVVLDFQVLKAAARNAVGAFFYPSGALVYDQDAPVSIGEEASTRGEPVDACTGAAWAKRTSEIAIQEIVKEFGLKFVVGRLSNLYGPGDDMNAQTAHLIGNTMRAVANDENPEIWGDGSQRRTYLYVTEAIDAVLRLMERDENLGSVNIGGQVEVSVRDLVQQIIEISEKPLQARYREGAPTGLSRKLLATTRLVALTGFRERVPLREGLERAYEWHRSSRVLS